MRHYPTIVLGAAAGGLTALTCSGFLLWLGGYGEPWISFAGGIGGGLIGGVMTLIAGYLAFNAAMEQVSANADEASARKALALRHVDRMILEYISNMERIYEETKDIHLRFSQGNLLFFFVDVELMAEVLSGDDFWRVDDEIQSRLIASYAAIRGLGGKVEEARLYCRPLAGLAREWKPVIEELRQIHAICENDLAEIRDSRRRRANSVLATFRGINSRPN